MRKIRITIILIAIRCISCISNVIAATEPTADLKIENTSVKPGDTITVVLNATCEQGLSYVGTEIQYNKDVLTLQNKTVSSDWVDYGTDKLELFVNSSTKKTNANLYTLTFKVNDNAEAGTIKITTTPIEIVDINNKEYTIAKVEKTITIVKEEQSEKHLTGISLKKAPNKIEYNVGEKFDTTGMVITATYSDGTTKDVTGYTFNPSGELSANDTKITITYTEDTVVASPVEVQINVTEPQNNSNNDNDINNSNEPATNPSNTNSNSSNNNSSNNNNQNNSSKTTTQTEDKKNSSNNKLPYTGQNIGIVFIIALIVGGVLIISYKGYEKYRGI